MTLREHRLLPLAIKPIAPGQAAQPFFVGLKLGLETGIGGKVHVQSGHFAERDDAVKVAFDHYPAQIVDKVLIAPGIGPSLAAKRFHRHPFRLGAFPGAGTERNLMTSLRAFLSDAKAIPLLPPVWEIVK